MRNTNAVKRTTRCTRLLNMAGFTYIFFGSLYNDFIYTQATLPLVRQAGEWLSEHNEAWYGLLAALPIGLYFTGQAVFPILISSRFAVSMTLTILSLLNPEAGYVGILLFTLVYALSDVTIGDRAPTSAHISSRLGAVITSADEPHAFSDTGFCITPQETWTLGTTDTLLPADTFAHDASTSLLDEASEITPSPRMIDPNTGLNWGIAGWSDPFSDLRTL